MPKWVYPLAFLFVLFLIFTDPTNASTVASGFADFLVTLLSGVGEFLTGLFDGVGDGDTNTINSPSPAESPGDVGTGTPAPGTPAPESGAADSFTHTHDGIPAHTHPITGE